MIFSLYNLFEEAILEETILLESVSLNNIKDAINKKYRVNITYSDENGGGGGKRTVEVYSLGKSKLGHDMIRVYQLFGATKTKNAKWKTIRVDRITSWEPLNIKFAQPVAERPSAQGHNIAKYRSNGDASFKDGSSMDMAKFDGYSFTQTPQTNVD